MLSKLDVLTTECRFQNGLKDIQMNGTTDDSGEMNSPLEKQKNSFGKQTALGNKTRATLPYYCSRSDLKSSSSLSSVNPRKISLRNAVFSSDNVSKTSEEVERSGSKGTKTVGSEEWEAKRCWCKEQPLMRKINFISQPAIPESSASRFGTNSKSSYLMNFREVKCIDDEDDDEDDGKISARDKVDLHRGMFDNDESQRLLPTHARDKSEETREEGAEVLSLSSDPQQPHNSVNRAKSKWNKIRNTVKMAGAFSPTYRKKGVLEREDSFLKRFSTRQGGGTSAKEDPVENSEARGIALTSRPESTSVLVHGLNSERWKHLVIGPNDSFLYVWLSVLTATILYNLWTCIAREAFSEYPSSHTPFWIATDVLCDVVYLLDIFVQFRTGYLEHGMVVYKSRKLFTRYVGSKEFALDLIALLPLDLLQFHFGIHPILRFPRFIKSYRLFRFVYMVETRTVYPNMWRVANLSHTVFLGCHWFAAFYFLISKQENFHTGWGYPTPEGDLAFVTQKYLRSLYWSTLTLTTIGDMPAPETSWEFVFTIVSYLIGVFVFATIVGQVGNVITNRNASRQEFERHLDAAKAYMRSHNVPSDMQKRVQRWYDYAWSRGRMNGGGDINSLGLLPDKLKTELALHVNLETLRKVTIFHECEPEFLHDLVLKMKAFIFTPGDLICRKGEVAREMFIIADGLIEVVSDSGDILKQMSAGDFFGEIGILNLDGVNKRTADVRSVGYSELFVLSRDDVLSAFRDHPEAEKLIKNYGRRRLQELDEHKKKTASLAKKLREKAISGELKNLLSIDLSPTSGSEGLLDNCSSSNRPLVAKEDKWLSLTANLLKQARVSGSQAAPEETEENPVEEIQSNVKPDEPAQAESKTTLRFSNWKTKWKGRNLENECKTKISSSSNTAPSSCLLPEQTPNNRNTNSNNNNDDDDDASQREGQVKDWSSTWNIPKSGSKISSETVQESGSTGFSCPSSSMAFDAINHDDFNVLCHDITKNLMNLWCHKFVGKMRTCEEQIMRLELENKRQQELIERLEQQLNFYKQ